MPILQPRKTPSQKQQEAAKLLEDIEAYYSGGRVQVELQDDLQKERDRIEERHEVK